LKLNLKYVILIKKGGIAMGCQKCTTTPESPKNIKKIVAFASHEYMLKKFYDIYKDIFNIENFYDYIIFNVEFDYFIKNISISKEFTQVELENINILPLELDEELTFSVYKKSKSLSYYINLYYSSDLKWILDNESIVTYFQPIVNCNSLEIVAYECLSRGIKHDGTVMPPNLMFESARKTDMLFNLDRQCRLKALQNAKSKNIQKDIFINFTPTSIYNPEFCLRDAVKTALELDLDFSKIIFEVVESERVEKFEHLTNILDFYRRMGFCVALDDVGSGYSTLNLLAQLKPNIIKIDMELIRDIDKNPAKRAVVSSIVQIATEIGAKTLAEGIETKGEFVIVKGLRVNLVQGYLFAKPSPEPLCSVSDIWMN